MNIKIRKTQSEFVDVSIEIDQCVMIESCYKEDEINATAEALISAALEMGPMYRPESIDWLIKRLKNIDVHLLKKGGEG